MSEPATRMERPESDTSFDPDVEPRASAQVGAEVVELSPTPEQLVDLGDGSLTLDALVIARDALLLQSEELTRRLDLYERAIKTWGQPRELTPQDRKLSGQSADPQEDASTEAPLQSALESRPGVVDEPSMIVCMEELMPLEASPSPQIDPAVHTRIRRRESRAKTQRLSTARSGVRPGVVWMLAIGLLLGGLTIWAGRSVSLASSGKVRAVNLVTPAVPVAEPVAVPVPLPSVQPLAPSAAPAAQPLAISSVAMSHFELVWGDTSVRRLRAALKRAIAKMNGCLDQEAGKMARLPAKLELSVRLREDGSITWVKGLRQIDSESAQSCIAKAIHRADYPESRSGLLLNTELTFKGR